MTGVVLRCPNCGTVHPEPGECAACHEAQVRCFCTNHSPGVWLNAEACPQCGARLGDPAPVLPSPAPEPAPEIIHPRRERRGEARPWADRPRALRRDVEDTEEVYPPRAPAPDLAGIVLDMLATRARGRTPRTMRPDYEEEAPPRRRSGCIGTLVTLALLFIGLLLLLPVIFSIFLGMG